MFTDSFLQRFLLEIYMWCSWICTNAYLWIQRSLLFCLKPLDLRFTCDVLGPVQMFTCEHKQKLVLSCLKHPYLRFTCDVLGFLWYIRASLLEIYMCRGWSWACTDVSLWAKRIFYGSLKPLYLRFTYDDLGSLEMLTYLWTEITFYDSSNHFCKQVHWAFALAIVSKFWERKQVAGIASFDCITLWILYVHIGVQRFGNQWNQSKCIIKILKNHMSALEFSYKFYMKFI